jgi:hypothetical protein
MSGISASPSGTQEVGEPIAEPWSEGVLAFVTTAEEMPALFLTQDGKPAEIGDMFGLMLDRKIELTNGAIGLGFKLVKVGMARKGPPAPAIATPDSRILVPGR